MKNLKNQMFLKRLRNNFNQLDIIDEQKQYLLKGGNGNEENTQVIISEDIVIH